MVCCFVITFFSAALEGLFCYGTAITNSTISSCLLSSPCLLLLLQSSVCISANAAEGGEQGEGFELRPNAFALTVWTGEIKKISKGV
jgi:hypothetical protein